MRGLLPPIPREPFDGWGGVVCAPDSGWSGQQVRVLNQLTTQPLAGGHTGTFPLSQGSHPSSQPSAHNMGTQGRSCVIPFATPAAPGPLRRLPRLGVERRLQAAGAGGPSGPIRLLLRHTTGRGSSGSRAGGSGRGGGRPQQQQQRQQSRQRRADGGSAGSAAGGGAAAGCAARGRAGEAGQQRCCMPGRIGGAALMPARSLSAAPLLLSLADLRAWCALPWMTGWPPLQLAFMHFRWEEEAGEPVLYLYEVQIEEAAQV